jgi:hypothetical protein
MLQLKNMHRDYNSGHFGNESVKAFTGLEIEHTLAYGKQTLFLATNEFDTEQVLELATLHGCEAVYYGANRTFQYNIGTHVFQMKKLLDNGYYVTIDYPYADHEEVKKRFALIWNEPKFIPFCSIIFKDSDDDKQLHFKIDDVTFRHSNPGVWTMGMKKFKDKSGFTDWDQYSKDEIIK